jgi:sugar phosphate permease
MGSGYVGLILGTPLVGWLIAEWGWRVMFYGTGALTLLGVVLFWLLVYDHPHEHPWISEEEKELIAKAVAKDRVTYDPQRGAVRPVSFSEGIRLLTKNPAFWVLCVAGFCALGVFFTNLSWLPGYLVKERGFTVVNSSFYLILPYAAAFAGALSAGCLGDRLGNRSAVALIAGLLTAPAIVGLLLGREVTTVILFMSLVLFLNAAAVNSLIVLLFDLFPAEVLGVTVAIFGGVCGGSGGIVGPIILGRFYDQTGSFFWGFCSLAAGAAVGAFILIPIVAYEQRVKREKIERAALAQIPGKQEVLAALK